MNNSHINRNIEIDENSQLLFNIFLQFKKDYTNKRRKLNPLFSNISQFMKLITNNCFKTWGSDGFSNFKNDYVSCSTLNQIKECLLTKNIYTSLLEEIINQEITITAIDSREEILNDSLKQNLIGIIDPEIRPKYSYKNKPSLSSEFYNEEELTRLYIYFTTFKATLSVGDILYNYMYLFVYKKCPPYIKNLNALSYFDTNILSMYGARADSATRAIITLATSNTENNIYADYEYADMLYYGKTHGVTQNFSEAYKYYKKAACISDITTKDLPSLSGHPLAFWSLSYILYNYKKVPRLKDAYIEEIEYFTPAIRMEIAMRYAKFAVNSFECAGAYNMLGNISRDLNESMRKKYELEDPLFYYNKAAEKKYTFAYNNIAQHYGRLVIDNSESGEINSWLEKYVNNLILSSDANDNYASNTLGFFFDKGYLRIKINNTERTLDVRKWIMDTYAPTEDPAKYSQSLTISKIAINYYKKAYSYILDENSAWAIFNMITDFPQDFDSGMTCSSENKSLLRQVGSLGNDTVNQKIIKMANANEIHTKFFMELVLENPILKKMYEHQ